MYHGRGPTLLSRRRWQCRGGSQAKCDEGNGILQGELKVAQSAVEAAYCQQLGVCAVFCDATLFDDVELVGFPYGGQSVSDGEGGSALHQGVEGALNEDLGFRVDR